MIAEKEDMTQRRVSDESQKVPNRSQKIKVIDIDLGRQKITILMTGLSNETARKKLIRIRDIDLRSQRVVN